MAKSIVSGPGGAVSGVEAGRGALRRRENDGLAPPLLLSRPLPARILLAVAVPALFGAVCGWVLGIDKLAYLILSGLAVAGGYLAGQEHDHAAEGAARGLLGGTVFGAAILGAHSLAGDAAKAQLPHPHGVLVGVTAGFGLGLGALGARRRARRRESGQNLKFDVKRLDRAELAGFAGSAVLFGALFMNWFSTSCDASGQPRGCNFNSEIGGHRGAFTAFQTYRLLDILLVLACFAPFVLAYLVATGRQLAWRPGEVTMIVGITAFTLIVLNGIILGRPGGNSPHNVAIALQPGYFVGMAGAAMISFGGYVRQTASIRSRKPPGMP
jgi:hypothetical protein